MTRTLERAPARRSWWVDGLVAALWWVSAIAVAFFVASGGLLTSTPLDYFYSLGRVAGIVASVLVMNQVLLIARMPWVERAIGHDTAASTHARMGRVAFILMLVHVGLILIMTAHYDGRNPASQLVAFWELGWFLPTAQIGFGLFMIVAATSLLIVRRRWKYESWHTVHLLVYVSIALVVPHQFIEGSTFRAMGPAWWFWLTLYVVTFGSWLVFRVLRPLVRARRHGLVVSEVTPNPDGSTSVVMTGTHVERLRALPGQFMLWRFLAPGYWREAHPYSLSRAADAGSLRITVKPSGDGSTALASIPVGTRVLAEGPLGIFTDEVRTRPGVVFVAAGIGITPLRAMLDVPPDGPCDVVLRAPDAEGAPLLGEVRELARACDATVHELFGSRGNGWSSAAQPTTLKQLIPDLVDRDVYICGPVAWADAVEADALLGGVAPESIHRERFGWA